MSVEKRATLPDALVPASAGQSPVPENNISITGIPPEINAANEEMEKLLRDLKRMNDPNRLHSVTMAELFDEMYRSKPPVIDGFLYTGTYLFAGAPKVGKSFMMAQLAYHVSTGRPLWGYPVRRGTVLYLALEDDFGRLQKRFYRMFGTDSAEKLHLAVNAGHLDGGLETQLDSFLTDYPDTKLIIIDTLQKVRELSPVQYSYANDYDIMCRLKAFADRHSICLLLVHHTRKQQAEDSFDMISGTNGLMGAADGAFLFHKEKRTSNKAVLDISGRDQQDQKLFLVRDEQKLSWSLERAENELWKEPPDPILDAVAALLSSGRPQWEGTPTELVKALRLNMKPQVLTMRLNVNVSRLAEEHDVFYANTRNHAGRRILLKRIPDEA